MGIQLYSIVEILKESRKNTTNTSFTLDEHIEVGMKWLSRAQDATLDGGVSIRYSLIKGWESSYPETTGYIIPTFLKCYDLTGDITLKDRAMKMAEWELLIQQEDGAFIGGPFEKPVGKLVFDTGQIIFGLIEAFNYSKDERFLRAAIRAGDWLVNVQDKKGYWERHSFQSIPHTYYSRVAWALVKLYKIIDEEKYLTAVQRNMGWALSNQLQNGWFQNAGFTLKNHKEPFTHTIAYTIEGVLEIGIILGNQNYINAAKKPVDELLEAMSKDGLLWGKYNDRWEGKKNFICLTGNAQLSIICSRLYQVTNNSKYLDGARTLNKFLRSKQSLSIKNQNIHGAIPGSYPIWGEYERFAYPNWATKFFVDALTLEKENGIFSPKIIPLELNYEKK